MTFKEKYAKYQKWQKWAVIFGFGFMFCFLGGIPIGLWFGEAVGGVILSGLFFFIPAFIVTSFYTMKLEGELRTEYEAVKRGRGSDEEEYF